MANTPDVRKKRSRILDALENPSTPSAPPAGIPMDVVSSGKRPSLSQMTPVGGKRRALGMDRGNLTGSPAVAGGSSSQGAGPSDRPPSPVSTALNLAAAGFNLNYDAETPIQPIDMGGPDQALRMAEFVTRSIDNLSHGVTVRDAMQKLNLRDNKDILPGLEVRLLPHQIIGVSWMLDQELKSPHKGGILADEMGLGKTVQMIATMAVNMPKPEDKHRTTLIVVPAALLFQWKEELEVKTNEVFTVHIHHGRDKLKKTSAIRTKDVIITTYQTLNMDFAVPSDVDPEEESNWLAKNGGVLARTTWFRVILDEAQFIRNRGTRSSKSVALLRSKYRWMLTGTPVTNTLADIYGLIRFGKFRPWNDWNDFNEYIAKVQMEDAVLAGLRAQEVLKPVLLRRTKDSELEGEPLLQLPKKNIDVVELDFSAEERELYDAFEKKVRLSVNRFFKQRSIVKNHSAVFVMILRLRQLCCHPHLILSLAEGYEDPTLMVGSDTDKEHGRALQLMGAAWVAEIKKGFLARARMMEFDFADEADEPESTCPICNDLFMNDSGRVLGCGHEICFDCLLDLRTSAIVHDGQFGHGTEQENLKAEKEYEEGVAKGYRPCPTCKKMNDCFERVFRSSAFEPSDEEMEEIERARRRRGRDASPVRPASPKNTDIDLCDISDDDLPDIAQILANRKGKDKKKSKNGDDEVIDLTNGRDKGKGKQKANEDEDMDEEEEEAGPLSAAVIATWRRGDHDLEPSTKMMALVKLLKEFGAAGDKTICYSQWTSMLDLVEILFNRYGIRSLRYDGKMDRNSREQALATFKKAGGPKVLLISTKCGGVGLNLVSANRVINLDLSWNYASESQAYDRVHRLGQEKEVFVKRLVVRNTIEQRMLKLQGLKTDLANAALGEGTGNLHKLSVKDIKSLFGIKQ